MVDVCISEKEHYNNILSRIKGLKQRKDGYIGLCPAHDDRNPSLSVTEKDGRILLKCHANCETADIVKALGLEMKDLFSDNGKTKSKPKYEAKEKPITYDYLDENGNLLFQVCRTGSKRFYQRRPDGQGSWINSVKGVKPVIYNLPAVNKAIENGQPVYIVEGEKDVNNLGRLGLTATCNPMGAGKWLPDYNEQLQNAIVFIIPDNDKVGKEHAQKVASELSNQGAVVHVLELPDLPESGDVTDFIEAGGSIDDLQKLAAGCSEWEPGQNLPKTGPELIRMDTIEAEEVSWLWPGLIPKGKLTMMEGDPGCGKTWLSLCLAATVSNGAFLPNQETGKVDHVVEPAEVLYMTAEDGIADTIKPRLDAVGAVDERIHLLEGVRDEKGRLNPVSLENMEPIEEAVETVKPALIIIDPIQGYLGGKTDMYRANEVRPLLASLGKLAERHGCAVVCIRHLTKGNSPKAVYRGMGSIDFAAAARSILLVGRDPDDQNKRAVIQTKNSLAEMSNAVGFTLERGEFLWTGQSDLTAARMFKNEPDDEERSTLADAKEFLEQELSDGPVESATLKKAAQEQGISYATLRRAKDNMKIESVKTGGKGAKWAWKLT